MIRENRATFMGKKKFHDISDDYSIMIPLGPARVKGKIRDIYDPNSRNVPPLSDHYTATIPSVKWHGSTITVYLKFPKKDEMKEQSIAKDEKVVVEGSLLIVDGKLILTDVRRV